ncbi:uncharacterized protein LOC105840896 [Monomorium pharaonis]|uniref:uncharacterized protein LOC105840896 n=1 Tax=Monomorium pharaonis TaxID=307658 RepID=UPI0017471F8F|nr:uncharacterized protein LOC105840896 [Monomorium pharaonis]
MSLEAENLIEAQSELLCRMSRTVENLKKTGAARTTQGAVESLQALDANWERFQKNHEALRTGFKKALAEHEYFKMNLLSVAEDTVIEQRGILMDTLRVLRDQSRDRAEQAATPAQPAEDPSKRKLPTIDLPFFSGNIQDWPAFRDLFLSILERHPNLASVERLHYLKTRVQDEAEERIRNLPTTAKNFQRAWAILEERYENKRVLVKSCLATFCANPRLKGESVADLKKLVHSMIRTSGALETIGRKAAYDNDFFVHYVTEMLDQKTRREWEDAIDDSKEPPTYEQLRAFLDRRLRTLEAFHPMKTEAAATAPSRASNAGPRAACSNLAQKQQKKPRCPVCRTDHYVLHCSKTFRKRRLPRRRR